MARHLESKEALDSFRDGHWWIARAYQTMEEKTAADSQCGNGGRG